VLHNIVGVMVHETLSSLDETHGRYHNRDQLHAVQSFPAEEIRSVAYDKHP
jgi:hypothetical protein